MIPLAEPPSKPAFTRYSKCDLAEGDYRIRVQLGQPTVQEFRLCIRNGTAWVLFELTVQGKLFADWLILDPSSIESIPGTLTVFQVKEGLPKPLLTWRSNHDILSNLKGLKVSKTEKTWGIQFDNLELSLSNHFSPIDGFSTLLIEHFRGVVGREWFSKEILSSSPSPLAKLDTMFRLKLSSAVTSHSGVVEVPADRGIVPFYVDLAYSFFWLANNSKIESRLVSRLKHKDQFWGALHECFVASSFLKAGFDLYFENEQDRSHRHPEFKAVFRATGETIAVEAKAIHRDQLKEFDFSNWRGCGLRVRKLLNDAIGKAPSLPYYVIIDVAMPPCTSEQEMLGFNNKLAKEMDQLRVSTSPAKADLWNAVCFVNRPFLFTENSEFPSTISVAPVYSTNPTHAHPSLLVSAHINEIWLTMQNTVQEMDRIARMIDTKLKNS